MFNPWKQAKQQKEAQKFAEAYLLRLRDAGEWFTLAEQRGEDVVQATDDENEANIIYYYAKSVYTFYDMIEANRTDFTTSMENDIITTLNVIVNADKNISLTDLLNQAIIVRYDLEHGALIMPQRMRFYESDNGAVCFGKQPTVA